MEAICKSGLIDLPIARGSAVVTNLRALEGRRFFIGGNRMMIEDTGHNRRVLKDTLGTISFKAPDAPTQAETEAPLPRIPRMPYVPRTAAYAHQTRALDAARQKEAFALFLEQGTGKTKVAIDRIGELYAANEIDAALIITKKGVHAQWVREQVPTHLGDVPHVAAYWDGKGFSKNLFLNTSELKIASVNIDSLITKAGSYVIDKFVKQYKGRLMIVVDESQIIKNTTAKRTDACYKLAPFSSHRLILTGTPIAKDLCDEWSQFKFLDENIVGVRYLTSFRNQFCVMGGFENRQVVGTRNLAEFKRRVDPYSFRVTKEGELDLPPKVYAQVPFEMHPEQKRHYKSLKDTFMTQLDNGEVVSVKIAATCLLRLQQITCGVLPPSEEGGKPSLIANPRMDALLDLLEQRPGKAIIWARFNEDIRLIKNQLGDKAVTYFGETSAADREKAVALFLDPNSGVDYFVSNPAAGGTGLNLQGGGCRTNVYYSNSFSSLDRWQSEDRTHRIGMQGTVTYFDLVCVGSPDRKILANLRAKKSISDLALGDIKEILNDDDID